MLLSRFEQEDGNFRILEINNVYFSRLLATQFPKIDVAAAYQHVLERVACNYVAHYVQKTGIRNIVLSGGVVANVKLNQRLKEIPGVEGIFVHPNMGDGGCGTGAALLEFVDSAPEKLAKPLANVYFGPSYSADEIADALTRSQLRVHELHADRAEDRGADRGGEGGRAVQRPHGIRAARARQPVDPLSRQGAGGEPVAQPAAGPHRVHAVRAGDAVREASTTAT